MIEIILFIAGFVSGSLAFAYAIHTPDMAQANEVIEDQKKQLDQMASLRATNKALGDKIKDLECGGRSKRY